MLELRAVHLILLHLEQGGVVSKTLNDEVCALYEWAIPRSLKLRAIHQPGVNNELADYLLHNRRL